jgi:hypothetical protein
MEPLYMTKHSGLNIRSFKVGVFFFFTEGPVEIQQYSVMVLNRG